MATKKPTTPKPDTTPPKPSGARRAAGTRKDVTPAAEAAPAPATAGPSADATESAARQAAQQAKRIEVVSTQFKTDVKTAARIVELGDAAVRLGVDRNTLNATVMGVGSNPQAARAGIGRLITDAVMDNPTHRADVEKLVASKGVPLFDAVSKFALDPEGFAKDLEAINAAPTPAAAPAAAAATPEIVSNVDASPARRPPATETDIGDLPDEADADGVEVEDTPARPLITAEQFGDYLSQVQQDHLPYMNSLKIGGKDITVTFHKDAKGRTMATGVDGQGNVVGTVQVDGDGATATTGSVGQQDGPPSQSQQSQQSQAAPRPPGKGFFGTLGMDEPPGWGTVSAVGKAAYEKARPVASYLYRKTPTAAVALGADAMITPQVFGTSALRGAVGGIRYMLGAQNQQPQQQRQSMYEPSPQGVPPAQAGYDISDPQSDFSLGLIPGYVPKPADPKAPKPAQ